MSLRQEPEGDPDSLLMQRIRDRDANAMALLYDRYNRLVFTVGLRVLGERSAAEDLTQDVFLRVWNKPRMEASESGMAAWFAVVARNRAIDVLRQKKHFPDAGDDSPELDISVPPTLDHDHLVRRAQSAISGLAAEQRQALELAYFEGLSHSEIAERTGIPLGTIKTRIRTGLATLKKLFQ